jgi:hypothetical protein
MIDDFPFAAGSFNQNIATKIGLPNDTNIEFIDDLAWILGNHSLHIGGSVQWIEGYNNQNSCSVSGDYTFQLRDYSRGQ